MPLRKGAVADPASTMPALTPEQAEQFRQFQAMQAAQAEAETPQVEAPAAPAPQEEAQPPFEHNAEALADAKSQVDPAQALAPAPASQALAPAAQANIIPGAPAFTPVPSDEEEDFEDCEVDRWSFVNIKLDKGEFKADDEPIGKSFECIMMMSKAKFVVKNTKCDKKDDASIFTYDRETDANSGELISDIIADWKGAGWGVEWRQYSEKQAVMVGGDLDKSMVIINIPPTSRTRYAGRHKQFKVQHKGVASTKSYVVRCSVGEEIKNGQNSYNKWKFDFVRLATPDDLAAE